MTYVLGIDPGLANLGWALVGAAGDLHSFEHVETTRTEQRGDASIRLARILRALRAPLAHASVVVIEWPGFGGARVAGKMNAVAASQTAAAAAAAMGLAIGQGGRRKILAPAPVTWRSKLGAKKGKDGALHAELLKLYPILADVRKAAQPHLLDALGCALFGIKELRLNQCTQGAA